MRTGKLSRRDILEGTGTLAVDIIRLADQGGGAGVHGGHPAIDRSS